MVCHTKQTMKLHRRLIDLSGKTFGMLTVLNYLGNRKWDCRCACGGSIAALGYQLTAGQTVSCGCRRKAILASARLTHGHTRNRKHSREHNSWRGAKERTGNPSHRYYSYYGGRGITMCDQWRCSFEQFLKDMGPCPPDHELERKDCNGNYEPSNCCWIPSVRQASNMRNSRFLTWNGKTQNIADWSREVGINAGTLRSRLSLNWNIDEVLHKPVRYKPSNTGNCPQQT